MGRIDRVAAAAVLMLVAACGNGTPASEGATAADSAPAAASESPAGPPAPADGAAKVLTGHTGYVFAVAFSPDGTTLATAGGSNTGNGEDHTVRLWNVADGTQLRVLTQPDSATDVAFSPDGSRLAVGGWGDHAATIWNLQSGSKAVTVDVGTTGTSIAGHNPVQDVAFSPDGRTLATRSADNKIRLWDAGTGAARQTFTGRQLCCAGQSIAYGPRGDVLAVVSDSKVQLWDPQTGQARSTLPGCVHGAVGFSGDGRRIVAGNCHGEPVRVLDTATGTVVAELPVDGDALVQTIDVSRDGTTVAAALGAGQADFTIRVWSVGTGQPARRLAGHTYPVVGVVISPDGRHLATASFDGTARLWNLA